MDGSPHLPNATPFDLISTDAEDLLTEARNWADGQPAQTQEQADEIQRLIDAINANIKAAEAERKNESRPHDDAKAAVQAKYAPLYADPKTKQPGRVHTAKDALKAVLAPFLKAQDDALREAERLAREEADRKATEAAEALRQADASDLAAREAAEAKVREAEQAERDARAASKDKAQARGDGRASGLRTKWVATVTDPREAAAHYWRTHPDAFLPVLQKLADDDCRAGKRTVPGITITEERTL